MLIGSSIWRFYVRAVLVFGDLRFGVVGCAKPSSRFGHMEERMEFLEVERTGRDIGERSFQFVEPR